MSNDLDAGQKRTFSAAEITALSHLFRGELYRSQVWRTRLDTTTNWAVATTGIAVSLVFTQKDNSPLPLMLMGLLTLVFLAIESRRYRFFDIWRTRSRMLEVGFFGPVLRGEEIQSAGDWGSLLAQDYSNPRFHISYWEAVGRRLRRNYWWIFLIQGLSFMGKIWIHPTQAHSLEDLCARASAGPLPGWVVFLVAGLFQIGFGVLVLCTLRRERGAGLLDASDQGADPVTLSGVKLRITHGSALQDKLDLPPRRR